MTYVEPITDKELAEEEAETLDSMVLHSSHYTKPERSLAMVTRIRLQEKELRQCHDWLEGYQSGANRQLLPAMQQRAEDAEQEIERLTARVKKLEDAQHKAYETNGYQDWLNDPQREAWK